MLERKCNMEQRFQNDKLPQQNLTARTAQDKFEVDNL